MAKSSNKQIEKDEKKIIEELSKNANKSINDIAKTCGFSRQKVWRVINNLEKNHTIWGYVAVTDEEKLNKKGYMMLIKRTNKPVEDKLIDKIVNRQLENEAKSMGIKFTNSTFTHGYYDWVICFNATDIRTVKGFVENFNKIYQGYISEIHLLETMFPVLTFGVKNPEIKKLYNFLKI